jgi:hypothetical protein
VIPPSGFVNDTDSAGTTNGIISGINLTPGNNVYSFIEQPIFQGS